MNGQTVLSKKQKDEMIKDFIERVNPYNPQKSDKTVDLRAYAKYVKEKGLSGKEITPEIMNMFVL